MQEDKLQPRDRRMLLAIPVVTLGMKGITGVWFVLTEMVLNKIPFIVQNAQKIQRTALQINNQHELLGEARGGSCKNALRPLFSSTGEKEPRGRCHSIIRNDITGQRV